MSVLDILRKCACCMLFFCAASSGLAAEHDAESSSDAIAREYQARGQAVLDAAVPRIVNALSTEERGKLGPLAVSVVPSRDPLRVQLEQNSPGPNRLVVSVGFLILQDFLVDASVVAVVSRTEPALVDYSVEIGKFALQANYPAKYRSADVSKPRPFWQHIGWTPERYAAFRDDPRTKGLVERATMQTHAWLVAYEIADRLKDTEDSDAVMRRAADLMVRARLAPVPALGASVLFSVTKHPDQLQHAAWICDARSSLLAAIFIGQRDQKTASGDRAANIQARTQEWQRIADLLEQRGHCAR